MNYDHILQLFIDNIAMWLSLPNIRTTKLLNSNYRKLLSRDGFWKHRIFLDFCIREEKEDQTWLERYQLATYFRIFLIRHAGRLFNIYLTKNNINEDVNKWIQDMGI